MYKIFSLFAGVGHARIKKFLSEEVQLRQRFFFFFSRGDRIQMPINAGHHGPPAKRKCLIRWRVDDGPTLNSGLVAL